MKIDPLTAYIDDALSHQPPDEIDTIDSENVVHGDDASADEDFNINICISIGYGLDFGFRQVWPSPRPNSHQLFVYSTFFVESIETHEEDTIPETAL